MSKLGPLEHRKASPGCLEHVYCTAGNGFLVATCHSANTLDAGKYAELFANAPEVQDQRDDLLAACKDVVAQSNRPGRNAGWVIAMHAAIQSAEAAIAKAEGEMI